MSFLPHNHNFPSFSHKSQEEKIQILNLGQTYQCYFLCYMNTELANDFFKKKKRTNMFIFPYFFQNG